MSLLNNNSTQGVPSSDDKSSFTGGLSEIKSQISQISGSFNNKENFEYINIIKNITDELGLIENKINKYKKIAEKI